MSVMQVKHVSFCRHVHSQNKEQITAECSLLLETNYQEKYKLDLKEKLSLLSLSYYILLFFLIHEKYYVNILEECNVLEISID